MTRKARTDLIQQIEKKRNSKVIAYITNDRANLQHSINADVVPIIYEHLLRIKSPAPVDLFLYSRGGNSDVPWSIVSMFREYCGENRFNVLVPFRSHSAATMIALGADEIVMTKKAELGPIDITLNGPYNPLHEASKQGLPISVEDVMGYFSLLKKVEESSETAKIRAFELISQKVNPLALGTVSRVLDQTKYASQRLLESRHTPYEKEKNEEISRKISSEIYSHNHAISRTEARETMGIEHCVNSEDAKIDEEMWNLYLAYKELFEFDIAFDPEGDLIEENSDGKDWNDLPIACVESTEKFDLQTKNVSIKRLRNVPPQITLNLQGLNFPQINFPNLPPNLTVEQAQQIVQLFVQQMLPQITQQVINKAAEEAAQRFVNMLPITGFQRTDYRFKWTDRSEGS